MRRRMMVLVAKNVDEKDYWICACVRRSKQGHLTHIRMNHRSVARCEKCRVTRDDSDRLDGQLRRDGLL